MEEFWRETNKRRKYASEELEKLRAKGKWMNVELNGRDKDTNEQERRKRIKESRYNIGSMRGV
jgi:hypothetical protein